MDSKTVKQTKMIEAIGNNIKKMLEEDLYSNDGNNYAFCYWSEILNTASLEKIKELPYQILEEDSEKFSDEIRAYWKNTFDELLKDL